jgi:hypothetical protein
MGILWWAELEWDIYGRELDVLYETQLSYFWWYW